MIVVGLTGYKGSGKNAVADILVRDYGFTAMAFADPLKRMLRNLDPIIGYDLYPGCCPECDDVPDVTEIRMSDAAKFGFDDQSLKHSPWAEEVRDLWERFGTDVFREEDEDYWVRKSAQAMAGSDAERIVFTDVRFENEADFIIGLDSHHSGYYDSSLWWVSRPGTFGGEHPAEQMAGLLGEEIHILNDGSLEDLEYPVQLAMDRLLNGDQIPGQLAFDFGATNE